MKIKIMTFNIQSCLDYKKKINGNRIFDPLLMANTIKTAEGEIIGLNEVRGEGPDINFTNQVKAIADNLGYKYYYFGKAFDLDRGPFGNAIISKYPFEEIETIPIPDPLVKDEDAYYETRCVIKAKIKDFYVLVTHIGLAKSEKINALKVITEQIKKIKSPLILMGDFNMTPDYPLLPGISDLLVDTSIYFKTPKLSFPSINPTIKIDYIFTSKDIKVLDADILEITASDHYPHVASIEIK